MAPELTVGNFSRATHLSVKTLRHYHDVGLLEPAHVNRDTGYRYYSIDQIPTAQVIRRLRDLEMPVADVKAVLTASDSATRNALIARHLDRLEARLAETRDSVDALRRLLERPETTGRIVHRTVPAVPAVAIHQVVDRDEMLPWWEGARSELQATVDARGLRATGPGGGLYAADIFERERGAATVFIPVDGGADAIGRVVPFMVPPAELAVMVHRGSLADIDVTYGELGSYTTAHEISIDGPVREYYVRDAHDTRDPGEWETEIGWPIFRADATGTSATER